MKTILYFTEPEQDLARAEAARLRAAGRGVALRNAYWFDGRAEAGFDEAVATVGAGRVLEAYGGPKRLLGREVAEAARLHVLRHRGFGRYQAVDTTTGKPIHAGTRTKAEAQVLVDQANRKGV